MLTAEVPGLESGVVVLRSVDQLFPPSMEYSINTGPMAMAVTWLITCRVLMLKSPVNEGKTFATMTMLAAELAARANVEASLSMAVSGLVHVPVSVCAVGRTPNVLVYCAPA